MRHACDEAAADRIAHLGKDDRYAARHLLQRLQRLRGHGQDDVRFQPDKLDRIGPYAFGLGTAPAIVDAYVAARCPTQFFKCLPERRHIGLRIPIVFGKGRQHAHAPRLVALLRPRRQRPRNRRAAEQGYELAPFQLIELHSKPTSQGRFAGYRIGRDQSAGIGALAKASPSSAMLTPATFACRAAPDDRAVSTLRIFLERVARRNRGRGSSKLRRATSCQIAGSYRNGCTLPFRGDLQEISKTFKTGCRWASSLTSRLRLGTPEFTCCRGVL